MKTVDIIKLLGITLKIKGFYYVVAAIDAAKELPEISLMITKDIYPKIAERFKTTPEAVEHAIRTAVNTAWINNKPLLEKIAGCQLAYKPSNKEFILMTAHYLKEDG
ncbi:MAG: sporulation initiation factor Spo0A C-terminal domain-containing protein [Blautia sp.]|jgi:hypothetical protein